MQPTNRTGWKLRRKQIFKIKTRAARYYQTLSGTIRDQVPETRYRDMEVRGGWCKNQYAARDDGTTERQSRARIGTEPKPEQNKTNGDAMNPRKEGGMRRDEARGKGNGRGEVYRSCDHEVQVHWCGQEPRFKLFSLARSRWLGISTSPLSYFPSLK